MAGILGGGRRQQMPSPGPIPQIDDAMQRINELRRQRGGLMTSRARNMLAPRDQQTQTAQRQVTGN